jgi:hypothetical protein
MARSAARRPCAGEAGALILKIVKFGNVWLASWSTERQDHPIVLDFGNQRAVLCWSSAQAAVSGGDMAHSDSGMRVRLRPQ